MTATEICQMSNQRLLAEALRVAAAERRSTADLLALLIEVERRGLHLAMGYSSLFTYCTLELRLSEQAAYSRITAARAARRFPPFLGLLANGALTLSSIGLLAPHLTDENNESLLAAAKHKSTRDVARLIACLHPQPDIAPSLRRVPVTRTVAASAGRQSTRAEGELRLTMALNGPAVSVPSSPSSPHRLSSAPPLSTPPRTVLAPLAPRRYLLRMTIGQETHDKLQQARALLRHVIPDGDPAAILDRGLTLVVEQAARTKYAARTRSRPSSGAGTRPAGNTQPRPVGDGSPRSVADAQPRAPVGPSRYIPAEVKRAVWTRDGGRCAFVGAAGRCRETAFLEFHHVVPFAARGPTCTANLQLRCRAHNGHEAKLFFGTNRADEQSSREV